MKIKICSLLLAAMAVTSSAAAASAEVMQVKAGRNLSEVAPHDLRRSGETVGGLTITYLVSGNRLSEFKPGSLAVTQLEAGGAGAPELKATLDDGACRVSTTGASGRFRIRIEGERAPELCRTLKLKGTVVMYGETPVVAVPPVALPESGERALGDYQLSALATDGADSVVRVTGNAGRLREVTVLENGRPVRPLFVRRTETGAEVHWRAKAGAKVTAGLTVRTADRPEFSVPFSFGE